jgi:hypothetical protein
MSLEDAIKEVAKAIQSHADAIREDIAQRNVDNEALRCLMRVEDEEPAPVVSLAEKRKEKQAAAPLTVYADTKTAESEYVPGTHSSPITAEDFNKIKDNIPKIVEHSEDAAALSSPEAVQKALDESLTEEYVIECFRKAMMPKPGVSQQENKDNVREILKKYGCVGPLLKDGKVSIKPEKWQDFTRELLS